MIAETFFIKSLLPAHYTCSSQHYGVLCNSKIGLSKDTPQWTHLEHTLKVRYPKRFVEIDDQGIADNKSFKIIFRP